MELESRIVMEPTYRNADAFRGLEEYSHIWLVEMDCASGEINDIQEYIVGDEISPFIQWVPRSVIENPPPMPENG